MRNSSMTNPITYPMANSLIRSTAYSTEVTGSGTCEDENEYSRRVNTIIIPPFTKPGIFRLPNMGFRSIKPDIRMKIREKSIICPISGI
jgi:hypothetical protein